MGSSHVSVNVKKEIYTQLSAFVSVGYRPYNWVRQRDFL